MVGSERWSRRPALGVFALVAVLASQGCERVGAWRQLIDRDPNTGGTNTTLEVVASQGDPTLAMAVRCIDGTTDIVLLRNEPLTTRQSATTAVAFGKGQAASSSWTALAGNKGLVFTGNTDAFIRSLFSARATRVRIGTLDHGTIEATFETAGLLNAMEPASGACDWAQYYFTPLSPTATGAAGSASTQSAPATSGEGFQDGPADVQAPVSGAAPPADPSRQ
jgi:hypothetical protein